MKKNPKTLAIDSELNDALDRLAESSDLAKAEIVRRIVALIESLDDINQAAVLGRLPRSMERDALCALLMGRLEKLRQDDYQSEGWEMVRRAIRQGDPDKKIEPAAPLPRQPQEVHGRRAKRRQG